MNCETTLKKIIQQKKIASDPVFDDKYLKTKTKSNKGRIHTQFLIIRCLKKDPSAFACP